LKIIFITYDIDDSTLNEFLNHHDSVLSSSDIIIMPNSEQSGGYIKLCQKIMSNEIDAVILINDETSNYRDDVNSFIRICKIYNVPLALNFKTASIILDKFKDVSALKFVDSITDVAYNDKLSDSEFREYIKNIIGII